MKVIYRIAEVNHLVHGKLYDFFITYMNASANERQDLSYRELAQIYGTIPLEAAQLGTPQTITEPVGYATQTLPSAAQALNKDT